MKITLVTKDGVDMSVDRDVVEMSGMIKNLLEDVGDVESSIPLPEVSHATLKKVLAFCEHHKNEIVPTDRTKALTSYVLSEWDSEFFKVEKRMLFDIIIASNYMDIKLLTLTTAKVIATKIAGMNVEEVKAYFD